MDSSETNGGTRRPCLLHNHNHNHNPLFLFPHHVHHHHHLHFSPHCPLHSHLLQPNSHGPHACPNPFPSLSQSNFQVPACGETYASDPLMIQEENEETFDEDEEDPVFVLTDEWREFFAKSEAKRKLAKKQARKKGKSIG